ncbi:OmpA family protein [Ottowia testudinis]|uniref:OmpA family protein n=1 Tax=Ottowia testudinis TaxID=2816950 RepID=A0A975H1D4_9BURK|nr:OmpA family protein [Ottowia testudinis]QTD43639.1 OmpA family protein [Ottowia testudinis]
MKVLAIVTSALETLPAVATTLMLASCGHQTLETRHLPATPSPAPQLAQVGYGNQADFVQCMPPQCPTRTQKTLGATPAIEANQAVGEEAPPLPAPRSLEALPAEASPSVDPDVAAITEHQTWSIPFAFGSARLGAAGLGILKQVTPELPTKARITVAGRTDDAGSASINDALAQARAATVRDYLVRARPELKSAITVEAAGKCCFAVPNDTPAGRARNRRVEITVARQAAPP